MKVTYRKNGLGWEGILKDDSGKIVWACGHCHHNREQSTKANGMSAVDCAGRTKLHQNPEWVIASRRAGYPVIDALIGVIR